MKSKPLKPAELAEYNLIKSIVSGKYPKNSKLPSERELAKKLNITRPTLREILQRLSRERWITICQGKSTVVNDYWKNGGLGILATLTKYGEFLPENFLVNLIEARNTLLPKIAGLSVKNASEKIINYLKSADTIKENSKSFVKYDWNLQILMAKHSQNPIYLLIFNDFKEIYSIITLRYFSLEKSRELAKNYYKELLETIPLGAEAIEQLVKNKMDKSGEIWKELTKI
jgi:GntR family transcriptional regulator, negative regulator for fad regulon and positive regulator of fabA